MSTVDVTFHEWNSSELVHWIVSLHPAYPGKYEDELLVWFTQHGITGRVISHDLDREDLTEWGIVHREDKKNVYGAIQRLLVYGKKYSSSLADDGSEEAASLSDDDEDDRDTKTMLTGEQRKDLIANGWCRIADPLSQPLIAALVQGYVRRMEGDSWMIPEILRMVISYYHCQYNQDLYIEIEYDHIAETYLFPKRNLALCGLFSRMSGKRLNLDEAKVKPQVLDHVLRYLGHHKGIKPGDIPKPIRSIEMIRNVEDPWDAHYINSYSKKAVFQIILAANYLDCSTLLHLGSAKIACLIKGKSPDEIRQILSEE